MPELRHGYEIKRQAWHLSDLRKQSIHDVMNLGQHSFAIMASTIHTDCRVPIGWLLAQELDYVI